MAADQNAREKLIQFLDERAFDPILRARPDRYSGSDRDMLTHVKGATERTKQRYHHDYTDAEEVRDRFRDDLSSSAAQRVQRELERLGLPTLHEIEGDFEDLCRDLGVGR
jgi:hypothetical protein